MFYLYLPTKATAIPMAMMKTDGSTTTEND